jgi:hypothetical protein
MVLRRKTLASLRLGVRLTFKPNNLGVGHGPSSTNDVRKRLANFD